MCICNCGPQWWGWVFRVCGHLFEARRTERMWDTEGRPPPQVEHKWKS